jgi:hypothetical protein
MEERRCKKCGVLKPIGEFPTAGTVKGVIYRRHKCNSCYVGMKDEYRKRNRKKFEEYKKTLSCADCGNKDHRVLEFHHTGEDKESNIGDMIGKGLPLKTILEEVKKCLPLCANCHRIRHYIERNGA